MRKTATIAMSALSTVILLTVMSGCKTTCSTGACGPEEAEKPAVKPACSSCTGGACASTKAVKAAPQPAAELAVIKTEALQVLLNTKAPLVLLDARTGKWDDGRRIPGALSLSAASTPEEIAKVITGKDTLVVTYCGSLQCPASKELAKHLIKLGYSNVLEYSEGIKGWTDAGLTVVTAKQ